jgi:hypothetical protein
VWVCLCLNCREGCCTDNQGRVKESYVLEGLCEAEVISRMGEEFGLEAPLRGGPRAYGCVYGFEEFGGYHVDAAEVIEDGYKEDICCDDSLVNGECGFAGHIYGDPLLEFLHGCREDKVRRVLDGESYTKVCCCLGECDEGEWAIADDHAGRAVPGLGNDCQRGCEALGMKRCVTVFTKEDGSIFLAAYQAGDLMVKENRLVIR